MTITSKLKIFNKCKKDFNYFCKKYIKLQKCIEKEEIKSEFKLNINQIKISEIMINSQKNLIISKHRQSGTSTIAIIFCIWKLLFFKSNILFLSYNNLNSKILHKIFINLFPKDLQIYNKSIIKFNSGQSEFKENNYFFHNYDLIVLDEMAFHGCEEYHQRLICKKHKNIPRIIGYSTLSRDNSTFNEIINFIKACKKINLKQDKFDFLQTNYNNLGCEKINKLKQCLNEKEFAQEYLCKIT